MDQDLQEIIHQKNEEIKTQKCFIGMLCKEIDDLNNQLCLEEDRVLENFSSQERVLRRKALTLDNLCKVIMPIDHMELLEKEGKPSTVTSENWSKMDREEKWMSMHQEFQKISPVYGFFKRARDITKDPVAFSKAMNSLFKGLRLRLRFFVNTGTLFTQRFENDLENDLHRCLCDGIY